MFSFQRKSKKDFMKVLRQMIKQKRIKIMIKRTKNIKNTKNTKNTKNIKNIKRLTKKRYG